MIKVSKSKKIGIMGGTFNPIHHGHLLLAEDARNYCGLDEILFMPSGCSYMKKEEEIVSNKKRIAMTALAIEDNSYFALSTLETEREGATYTCDTVRSLKELHPENEFYFILGADNLFTIETWKSPDIIFKNCNLIVAARGEKEDDEICKKAKELEQKFQDANIIIMPERKIDISSSEIRKRIKNDMSVRYMLPDKVRAYIYKYNLYQDK